MDPATLRGLRRTLAAIEPGELPPDALPRLVTELAAVVAASQAALVRAADALERATRVPAPDGAGRRAGPAGTGAGAAGQPAPGRVADGAAPSGRFAPRPPLAGSAMGWLIRAARLTDTAAVVLLVAARALGSLPTLAAAFRAGEVGLDHVLALTVPLTTPGRLAAFAGPVEADLTALARRASPAETRSALVEWLERADPAGAAGNAESARLARSLSVRSVPGGAALHPCGRVMVTATLPVDAARTLLTALGLAAYRTAAGPPDDPAGPAGGAGWEPTPGQRRADALLALARHYLATAPLVTTTARSG
ncbi:MAG: DUF222 domain-containing protein [Frankia sp.]|nr:DUF222 domain-containing protein [Frankia sp.]